LAYNTWSKGNAIKNKLVSIKTRNFRVSKDTTNKVKKDPIEWEKIFANYVSNKELISSVHRELQFKKKKNLVQKWVKALNRHFSKVA
jgi:hypothetical protein